MKKIIEYIIAGTLFIVPFAISIWVLYRIFIFLEKITGQFFQKFIPALYFPGMGLVSLLVILLFFGFLAKNVLGRRIFRYLEKIFLALPLLNKIYTFFRTVGDNILNPEKKAFKDVVLVEFPEKGTYMLGFITGKPPMQIAEKNPEKNLVNIFIPLPNNFFIMKENSELQKIDLSAEEAFKLILSAGIFKTQQDTHT